jgi:hypothetical protein
MPQIYSVRLGTLENALFFPIFIYGVWSLVQPALPEHSRIHSFNHLCNAYSSVIRLYIV